MKNKFDTAPANSEIQINAACPCCGGNLVFTPDKFDKLPSGYVATGGAVKCTTYPEGFFMLKEKIQWIRQHKNFNHYRAAILQAICKRLRKEVRFLQ